MIDLCRVWNANERSESSNSNGVEQNQPWDLSRTGRKHRGRELRPIGSPCFRAIPRRSGTDGKRPTALTPDLDIFTRSKLPWVTLPEGVPAFEVYYTKALWPAASLERRRAILG
jgi:hypothetical protein